MLPQCLFPRPLSSVTLLTPNNLLDRRKGFSCPQYRSIWYEDLSTTNEPYLLQRRSRKVSPKRKHVRNYRSSHPRHNILNIQFLMTFFSPYGAEAQIWPWPPHSWGFYITHNDTPQSVGLLWTSDQLVAETSTWQQHTTLKTNIHARGGIRTYNLSRRAAAHLRLRQRCHWDRLFTTSRK